MSKLADNLNAEIVQGTVQSVAEAAQWLGYTYLYVRMLKNPEVYGVPPDQPDDDPTLLQFRVDLVRTLLREMPHLLAVSWEKGGVSVCRGVRVSQFLWVNENTVTLHKTLNATYSITNNNRSV